MSRIHRRARRVAGMGLAELGDRTRQASARWIDRIHRDGRAADPMRALGRYAPPLADAATLRDRLEAGLARRFFAGVPAAADRLREVAPAELDVLRAEAEVLLTRHFDLLGYERLWFGDPIDWHLDPVHGVRAPRIHWSRIDPLDPAMVGDSKVVWELSRHQWIVRLAQAGVLFGDDRYAAAAAAAIDDWLDANPPGVGINWTSSLEVALRLVAWTWVLSLLSASPALSEAALMRVLAAIRTHATYVEKYLSRYFSPNTHLTGEALGLFYAGVVFPEFTDSERWRATGSQILITQADRQISGDGVYFEQSTHYQRYTCEFYLHYLLLASRNRLDVPARIREHVERMIDVLAVLQGPGETVPEIGDADGGQLLALSRRAPLDCRGVFAVGAELFGRADFAQAAGGPAPEIFWLLGDARHSAPRTWHPAPSTPGTLGTPGTPGTPGTAGTAGTSSASRIFTTGGYAVMRAGAHQLIVDIGPIGAYAHGHADLLSVQCSIFGEPCLVDAGTFGYTADMAWRDYFRNTAAHNTVRIDNLDQAPGAGPFGWQQRPRVRLRAWQSTSEVDVVDAEHHGYIAQGIPVIHRRRVAFVKPNFWIVIDDLIGHGHHQVEWAFQCAPLPVALDAERAACVDTASGAALWIVPVTVPGLQADVKSGERAPIRGWISPAYGRRVAAPMIVYSTGGTLPMRCVTVLIPQQRHAPKPIVLSQTGAGDLPERIHVQPANALVRIDDTHVQVDRG